MDSGSEWTDAREVGAIGDKEILRNSGIRDDDEELITKPKRVQRAKLLIPVV